MLINYLQNDRLHWRIVSGLVLGIACMYVAWGIGYWGLPEGVLRGRTGAGAVSDVLPENVGVLLLALIWNGVIAFVVVPLLSLLAIQRLSLGYLLALGNFALYGIFLGTNSFSNPRPQALPPNLAVFLATGPWEIGSYMLVAATLANRFRFRQEHWLIGKMTRVVRPDEKMSIGQWVTLVVAVVVIIVTAWIEDARATRHTSETVVPVEARYGWRSPAGPAASSLIKGRQLTAWSAAGLSVGPHGALRIAHGFFC